MVPIAGVDPMPVGAPAVPPMDASTSQGGRLTVQPFAGTVGVGW